MSARLSRHVLAAVAATCALAFAAAGPAVARPGIHPPTSTPFDARHDPAIRTSSLAGTTEADHAVVPTLKKTKIGAPDDGATTIAVLAIAGGALLAGAGAGFAGGRRIALRTH
jgi:hypothetical protein